MNKSLKLKFRNITCHKCNFKPDDEKEVLNSLKLIGSYDYKNKTYDTGSEPAKNAWEVVISGDVNYIREDDTSVNILDEGLFFYCPDCMADLDDIE